MDFWALSVFWVFFAATRVCQVTVQDSGPHRCLTCSRSPVVFSLPFSWGMSAPLTKKLCCLCDFVCLVECRQKPCVYLEVISCVASISPAWAHSWRTTLWRHHTFRNMWLGGGRIMHIIIISNPCRDTKLWSVSDLPPKDSCKMAGLSSCKSTSKSGTKQK